MRGFKRNKIAPLILFRFLKNDGVAMVLPHVKSAFNS